MCLFHVPVELCLGPRGSEAANFSWSKMTWIASIETCESDVIIDPTSHETKTHIPIEHYWTNSWTLTFSSFVRPVRSWGQTVCKSHRGKPFVLFSMFEIKSMTSTRHKGSVVPNVCVLFLELLCSPHARWRYPFDVRINIFVNNNIHTITLSHHHHQRRQWSKINSHHQVTKGRTPKSQTTNDVDTWKRSSQANQIS